VNRHIRLALKHFGNVVLWHCYWVVRVAFRAEVEFVTAVALALEFSGCIGVVEVHMFLYCSSMSADSWWCHVGKQAICSFDFDESSLGVILSHCSPFYCPETKHPASSLLGLCREVS
jgi:hypothetical protein